MQHEKQGPDVIPEEFQDEIWEMDAEGNFVQKETKEDA